MPVPLIDSFLERCASEPSSLPRIDLVTEAAERKRPVLIYPAARMALNASKLLKEEGFDLVGFGDGDSTRIGQTFDSLPVYDADTISKRFPEAVVFVASSMYDSAIRQRLAQAGCRHVVPMPLLNHWFPKAFISREYEGARELVCDPANHAELKAAFNLWADAESKRVFLTKLNHFLDFDKSHIEAIRSSDPIYFESDLFALTDHEIFVDCGAFTGDTFRSFAGLVKGRFKRYYAFEPDQMLWERLRGETAGLAERVEVVQAGVGEKSGHLSFVNTGKGDGRVVEGKVEGAVTVPITTLDEFFADREPPSFIKADIEGVELSALRGARGLIQAHAPILAFSIYHRPSELWQLPLLVRKMNPKYRFHIRHYTHETDDTVCYAIPPHR